MNKFFKSIIIIIILSFSVILLNKFYINEQNIKLKDNKLRCNLKYRGLKKAVDVTGDENENYYIAYKTKLQYIDSNGKSFIIFSNKNMNINSLEYYKETLYFSSDESVYAYDLHKKECNKIISDLPNFGDYKDSIIKINNDYLYITIGASTNSGVVGKDNKWLENNSYNCDVSPYKIVLKGLNFGNSKTGAFVSYKTKSIKGQIVPGHFPGNASVIMYNLKTKLRATYAWGIKNVEGLDFDSKDRMIVSIGGMENRGSRAVKGDTDYIYILKYKNWYGWPDYSGGDPITSPKFKSSTNGTIPFVLENHPTENPRAPFYVHKNLSSLKKLSVDKKGTLGEIDDIYFYDDKDKNICSINEKGILKEKIKFKGKNKISSIKYINNKIVFLDYNTGDLYELY